MSTGSLTAEDGCSLAYEDCGEGLPVLWQHGLGADRRQPAEVFPDVPGLRRITLECRGHGKSALGDPSLLSIEQFAADAKALLDHLRIDRVVLGGISLGAAISMRLAAALPRRAEALILARPAWVSQRAPFTMKPYLVIAELLTEFGPTEGLLKFNQSEVLAVVESVSPDNAASLRSFFARETAESTIELLSRIPLDGPSLNEKDITALEVPTLIIANGEEYVHPLHYAERLRNLIPNAILAIVTSKTVDKGLYQSQFRNALTCFLQGHGVKS